MGGIFLEIFSVSSWAQILKLIPLGLIAVGSGINMAQRPGQQKMLEQGIPQTEVAGYSEGRLI